MSQRTARYGWRGNSRRLLACLVIAFAPFFTRAQIVIQSAGDGDFSNPLMWHTTEGGEKKITAPGCRTAGSTSVTIEHEVSSNCEQMDWYGEALVSIVNEGKLTVDGNVHLFGNAELNIFEGSMMHVKGDLLISGNAAIELNGSMQVDGRVVVSGEADVCGEGKARVAGAISGAGWCFDIRLQPTYPLEVKASLNDQNAVVISWKTMLIQPGDYFLVESSSNGMTYEPLGKINASQGADSAFRWYDMGATDGTYYYLVTHYNSEGEERFREVASFTLRNDDENLCELEIIPNPCVPYCDAKIINCPNGNFRTNILDASGNVIQELVPSYDSGMNINYHINKDNFLMPGVYIVNSVNDKARLSKKVIIK